MASSNNLHLLGFAFGRGSRAVCPVKGIDTTGHFRKHYKDGSAHGVTIDVPCSPLAREDHSILPLLRQALTDHNQPIPEMPTKAPEPAVRIIQHGLVGETQDDPIADAEEVAEFTLNLNDPATLDQIADDERGMEEGTDAPTIYETLDDLPPIELLEAQARGKSNLMELLDQAALAV
jgi:hypothetical protein